MLGRAAGAGHTAAAPTQGGGGEVTHGKVLPNRQLEARRGVQPLERRLVAVRCQVRQLQSYCLLGRKERMRPQPLTEAAAKREEGAALTPAGSV